MNKKLIKHLNEHKLTYYDLVVDITNIGAPKWNPEVIDYLIDNGIKPTEFWKDYDLDLVDGLRGYEHNFISAISQAKRKRLIGACKELLKYSKDNLNNYMKHFNNVGDHLENLQTEFEKVERELDTVPHSKVILLGLKRQLDDTTKEFYGVDFQINWILEDVLKIIEQFKC